MKWLAFTLALLPQMGMALSCLEPDIRRQFSRADASEHSYAVLHGIISEVGEEYVFEGRALARMGWAENYATELSVQSVCFGQWCGGVRTNVEGIFFVKQTNEGLLLEAGPCNAWAHYEPRPTDVGIAEQCMLFGLC